VRFRALRALLPIGILVLLAPAAQASTLVGSATGTADTNMTACFLSPYCTSFTAGGAPSPVVGSDGVIVTWRINAGSAPIDAQTRLRVVRPLGGGTFTGAGTSAVVTPATIGINAYPTRLKVQAGDIIGVDNDDQALYFDSSGAAFTATYFNSPGLADGATQAPSGTNPPAKRLLLEADLEPDIDGDGFGDETQDACPRASTDQTLPCDPDDIGVAAGGGAAMPPGIPPGPGGVLAAPVTGKSVNVDTVSGTVLVKVPGSKAFVVLGKQERQIPTGSIIDTRKGRVTIVTGVGTGSKATQSAVFYDGVFKFTQPRAKRDAIAEATLVGKLENCPKRKARGGAFDAGKRRGRRLWGSGKGRFRTRGRRSSTTVRGTVWLVEDRCDGTTLNRVTRGKVVVRDFGRRRNINLKAPGTYVARP
jgi:hypothetical protein